MNLNLDDIIVAVSSAWGHAPVGIVRLTGPGADNLADGFVCLANGGSVSALGGYRRTAAEVRLDADRTLPAAVHLFREPRSYTRQDMIEIHTVGSPVVLDAVVQRAVELGARRAEAGEFTARAFLNGAMDLTQAESVAAVIRAETDAQLAAARRLGDGYLKGRIDLAGEELARLVALVEASIDFAEEPIDFMTPAQLMRDVAAVAAQVRLLTQQAVAAERMDAAARVLLFGRPNAGKSSLLNALSATDRAICSAVAGTTRDLLSAPTRLRGMDVVLLDGAGVDKDDDDLIAVARQLVLAESTRVDLVCVVVDATDHPQAALADLLERLGDRPYVVVANKCDLLPESTQSRAGGEPRASARANAPPLNRLHLTQRESDGDEGQPLRVSPLGPEGAAVLVSAVTGAGLDALRAVLAQRLGERGGTVGSSTLVLTARQREALAGATASMQRARDLAASAERVADCADLVAFELRDALDALGQVTGRITTEDLLGRIFGQFCIGK